MSREISLERILTPYLVWTEDEIKEVKQVAEILLSGGFKKRQIAHWLDVSESSIYNWIKKGEIAIPERMYRKEVGE